MESSTHTTGHAQSDGRRFVAEMHTDVAGRMHRREWLAGAGLSDSEIALIRDARAIRLDEQLADQEFLDRIGRLGALNLQYQTGAQFATRLRELYKSLMQEAACSLAWWLIEEINQGFITDTQVRNAFGMTTNQWNTLKSSKLVPQHDFWSGILTAAGE